MVQVGARPVTIAALTPKQAECTEYQRVGNYTHFLTPGGGRSTKTFRHVRLMCARAILASQSRHAIVRRHFRTVKASVMRDTFPKVMRLCFPGVAWSLNKTDAFAAFPNGSEIWFLGLDDETRAEKVLGMEFATIFLNEISELAYSSASLILTRLAQNVALPSGGMLPLMALYDCNPPKTKKHWSYQLFFDKSDPITAKPLPNPGDYGVFSMNPRDNPLLPEATKRLYQNMSPSDRKRFWDGEYGDDAGGMWTWADFRPMPARDKLPDFRRIVVAVDPPAGTMRANAENGQLGAEAGIVIAALGTDGRAYVLADRSIRGQPEEWGQVAVRAYTSLQADCIVGEVNQGGDMVRAVIHAVDPRVNFKAVRASRGKAKRAEPVRALYGEKQVFHATGLDTLETQMCEFTTDFDVAAAGYSPDRVDALVWALTELMLSPQHGVGKIGVTGT
jgi:phage terminase large subunit-like protein